MLNATNLEHLFQDDCSLQCLCIYVVSCACLRVFGAVEGCLGANARRGHVIVSVITGNIFSRLAPVRLQNAKQSRSYFHGAVFWRQTYVVDICGGRICGLQCLAIASQHGGGWGRMGISQLRYRYRSPLLCVRVGDGWGYRSSILRNCNIGITAVISISQLQY